MTHQKGLETLDDEIDAASLEIEGAIPTWLSGTLLRNGPAQFEVGDEAYRHWFDGHAMLRAFRFDDGRVDYANRFLESETRTEALEAGEIVRGEFGTDPCKSLFGRAMQLFSPPEPTDNANVNVARLADRFVAMTETPMPIVFDDERLATEGHLEYDDELDADLTTAHHPRRSAARRCRITSRSDSTETSTNHEGHLASSMRPRIDEAPEHPLSARQVQSL